MLAHFLSSVAIWILIIHFPSQEGSAAPSVHRLNVLVLYKLPALQLGFLPNTTQKYPCVSLSASSGVSGLVFSFIREVRRSLPVCKLTAQLDRASHKAHLVFSLERSPVKQWYLLWGLKHPYAARWAFYLWFLHAVWLLHSLCMSPSSSIIFF